MSGAGEPGAQVLYRGPLQRSRLSFLGEAAAKAYGPLRLIWVSPARVQRERVEHFQRFIASNPAFADWEIVDGRAGAFSSTLGHLRRIIGTGREPLLAVGFTSAFYAAAVRRNRWTWCVNGIPEERLLFRSSAARRVQIWAQWRAARALPKPDLAVTVSEPMARLVERRCHPRSTFVAPNTANLEVFAPPSDGRAERRVLAYMGTAAPWQCLPMLAELWRNLKAQDPGLVFRVISRDPGTQMLREAVGADSVEMVSAEAPREVARHLWDAAAGFLVRTPDLVNQVSFPLKFGEYLAAGAMTVVSDIGWQPSDITRRTGCGVLVDQVGPDAARRVLDAIRSRGAGQKDGVARACLELDRASWVDRLAARLPS